MLNFSRLTLIDHYDLQEPCFNRVCSYMILRITNRQKDRNLALSWIFVENFAKEKFQNDNRCS